MDSQEDSRLVKLKSDGSTISDCSIECIDSPRKGSSLELVSIRGFLTRTPSCSFDLVGDAPPPSICPLLKPFLILWFLRKFIKFKCYHYLPTVLVLASYLNASATYRLFLGLDWVVRNGFVNLVLGTSPLTFGLRLFSNTAHATFFKRSFSFKVRHILCSIHSF